MPVRKLLPGQGCQIWTVDPTGTDQVRWFETASYRLESPNWLSSGDALLLNGEGRLWRLPLSAGAGLKPVEISQVPQLNNDHVLDPDGKHIYLSTYDRQLYRAPIHGGAADRVSDPSSSPEGLQHYLHGVHPRGDRLAVVGLITTEDGDRPAANIYTMSAGGGDYRQLTFGPGHSDGAEYSPDGDWVYFNTECFDGQAQIARVRPDGSDLQQLTFDNCVNWFPHLSPDGRWA
ncbi:MAG: biopolymer transporter Tol, partial [Jatrophihabitantaceae bacterium]